MLNSQVTSPAKAYTPRKPPPRSRYRMLSHSRRLPVWLHCQLLLQGVTAAGTPPPSWKWNHALCTAQVMPVVPVLTAWLGGAHLRRIINRMDRGCRETLDPVAEGINNSFSIQDSRTPQRGTGLRKTAHFGEAELRFKSRIPGQRPSFKPCCLLKPCQSQG